MSAFGLKGGGPGIRPYIKYNAKSGRFYRVDRKQTMDGWASEEIDITDGFRVAFDFTTLQAGYIRYTAQGPEYKLKPYPYRGDAPEMPEDTDEEGKLLFKPGFKVNVVLEDGEEREFSSTAGAVVASVAELHEAYEAEIPHGASPPDLPIVELDGRPKADKRAYGNFAIKFKIVGWMAGSDVGSPGAGAFDTQAAAVETGLKNKIDNAMSVDAVTDIMLSPSTQKALGSLPQGARDEIRDHAKARLRALGWPGKDGKAATGSPSNEVTRASASQGSPAELGWLPKEAASAPQGPSASQDPSAPPSPGSVRQAPPATKAPARRTLV